MFTGKLTLLLEHQPIFGLQHMHWHMLDHQVDAGYMVTKLINGKDTLEFNKSQNVENHTFRLTLRLILTCNTMPALLFTIDGMTNPGQSHRVTSSSKTRVWKCLVLPGVSETRTFLAASSLLMVELLPTFG